ncbi:Fatty acid-binding protein 3 [Intoshia linei]|uniref:Fatty acid-binding protein 3 n=1 Tax=Intoshia linei TaxID=1819745 RepID=A0A177BD68_9BILA|nr:Fatty acid-binding protein 3 [Intoshia linei]
MSEFNGNWILYDSRHFDDYLKQIKVGFLTRKILNWLKTEQVIYIKENRGLIITNSTFKNSRIDFVLGEEFIEERGDGQTYQTLVTLKDNKIIQFQRGNCNSKITRKLKDKNTMIMTLTTNKCICQRIYKRRSELLNIDAITAKDRMHST